MVSLFCFNKNVLFFVEQRDMTTPSSPQCPFRLSESPEYTYIFRDAPQQNIFVKCGTALAEWLSRLSVKSIKNAWLVGKQNDTTKMFELAWKTDDMISKCRTLLGTVYVTANTNIMKAIFQNPRSHSEGLFWDKENSNLFIKTIMNDLYPEDLNRLGLEKVKEMIIFTASEEHIKALRSPLVSVLGARTVKEYMPQLNKIASNFFESLTDIEKVNCDGEKLAFEFAITLIAKLITGYETTRENYITLTCALNMFGKKMTSVLSHRPFTKKEQNDYQQAILTIRSVIESNISAPKSSLLVMKMKELGWDNFQIRANLFFMYFAGTETTASSINYLLWQLGKNQNIHFLEKLRDPEHKEGFLSQIIAETLRMHPASFIQGRQFRNNTLFEAYDPTGKLIKRIKLMRHHSIVCLTQVAALDPLKFVNAIHFNPNQFDADNPRSQLSWHPFGAGTHVCPGQYFALAELEVFISQLVEKFNIELVQPDEHIQQKGFFTLRATPVHIKLIDRCANISECEK